MWGLSKKHGFSLIELALILLVLSFITVVFIESNEQKRTIGKQATTHRQIETVQNAIETYAKAFGYYPCPADPSIPQSSGAFGHNPDSGNGDCQLSGPQNLQNDTITSNKGVVMGMIPVRDLSIPFDNAFDTYGNRLMYAISEELTFTLAATGQIKILSDYPETAQNVVTENGVYVILSYGEDGIGAYRRDGSGPITPLTMGADFVDSEEQAVNHHVHGGAGFDNIFLRYYTHDPTIQFDDQLTWISRKVEPCKKVNRPWDYNLPIGTAPQVWLDAAEAKTIIMNNGKEVTNGNFATWCDKSATDTLPAFSYGKNFISRPETGAASLNSLNVVQFDGVNDGMLIDDVLSLDASNPYTAFIVNRYYNTSALGRSLQGRDADWWFGLNEGGNHGHTNVATTAAGTNWHLSTVTGNSATTKYYGNFTNGSSLNGAASFPGRLGLSSGAEPLGLRDINNIAVPSSVEIAEVIVFDSDLSAVDVQDVYDVEDYLADKWGTCLGDEVYQNNRCECPEGTDATPPARSCCSAPRQVIGGVCQCASPKNYDSGSNSCNCPGYLPNEGSNGNCYAACGTNKEWNAPSNSCVCSSSFPNQGSDGNCYAACNASQTWDAANNTCFCHHSMPNMGSDGFCYGECKSGFIWDAPTNSCVCPPGSRLEVGYPGLKATCVSAKCGQCADYVRGSRPRCGCLSYGGRVDRCMSSNRRCVF